MRKPLKRFRRFGTPFTQLKLGVNDIAKNPVVRPNHFVAHFVGHFVARVVAHFVDHLALLNC